MEHPVSEKTPDEKQPSAKQPGLTRAQVAARLGVSISKVRTMEGKALHPRVENGVHYFDATAVEALSLSPAARPRRRQRLDDGQIAARVFYMIDHGKEVREIVQELEVTPQVVRALYREWADDFEGGEERRRRTEKEAKEERDLAQANDLGDREQRDWERTMAAMLGRERR